MISGDDSGLIKIWSSENGLLINSMRGHNSNICKIYKKF